MAMPTLVIGQYHMNKTKPVSVIASGLFVYACPGFGIDSLTIPVETFARSI